MSESEFKKQMYDAAFALFKKTVNGEEILDHEGFIQAMQWVENMLENLPTPKDFSQPSPSPMNPWPAPNYPLLPTYPDPMPSNPFYPPYPHDIFYTKKYFLGDHTTYPSISTDRKYTPHAFDKIKSDDDWVFTLGRDENWVFTSYPYSSSSGSYVVRSATSNDSSGVVWPM